MAEEKTGIVQITMDDISKAENCVLNTNQLNLLLGRTPTVAKYTRPAKGGGEWTYVTGTYIKKVLNLAFGWDWSFEVKEYKFDLVIGQVFVLGRLTVTSNGKTIIKEQFGRQDIKFKVEWIEGKKHSTNIPLDLGNDLKAATTDALKKCASELGIASDVYAPNEFKSVRVMDEDETDEGRLKFITEWMEDNGELLTAEDKTAMELVVENQEVKSYNKIIRILKKLKAN